MIFSFNSAELEEFALLSEKLPDNFKEMFVDTTIGVKVNVDHRTLLFDVTVQYIADEVSQMKIKGLFSMIVKKDSWENLIDENQVVFNKEILHFLGQLSIDTLRGMMVLKLNNTFLKNIILPPINVKEILNEDLSFDLTNNDE